MDSYINFKNIFTDFMKLNYNKSDLENDDFEFVRDVVLSDQLSFARYTNKGCTLYSLLKNSSSFFIPKEWVDLFRKFNNEYRDIMSVLERKSVFSSYIDKFGCLINFLLKILYNNQLAISMGNQILDIIKEIKKLKTEEFIEWCKKDFNVSLRPFEIRTINNVITI